MRSHYLGVPGATASAQSARTLAVNRFPIAARWLREYRLPGCDRKAVRAELDVRKRVVCASGTPCTRRHMRAMLAALPSVNSNPDNTSSGLGSRPLADLSLSPAELM